MVNPFESPTSDDLSTNAAAEVPRNSTWPTAIGIVGMVFGVLGMLGGIVGVVSNLFIDMMPGLPDGSPNPQLVAMKEFMGLSVGVSVLAGLLALWLLVGSIMLLKKNPSSRGTLLGWALAKGIGVFIIIGVNTYIQFQTMDAAVQVAAQAGPMADTMEAVMRTSAIVGAVVGIVWGLALPIFLGIWLSREKIKAEVATW